jgi:hypothetical protein
MVCIGGSNKNEFSPFLPQLRSQYSFCVEIYPICHNCRMFAQISIQYPVWKKSLEDLHAASNPSSSYFVLFFLLFQKVSIKSQKFSITFRLDGMIVLRMGINMNGASSQIWSHCRHVKIACFSLHSSQAWHTN